MASRIRRPLAAINITPLVDVLLILLAVLILAMPMYAKRYPVSLPKTTSATGVPSASTALSISLSSDGTLYIGDKEAKMAEILAKISPETSVEVAIHSTTQYSKIAELLANINDKSPKSLSLVTK